ncbi:ARM repeat-containing protein [Rozella allomycis CSF55]|uniref:ARM repeat-containing protein n=1 Tax=Rozella allomycis (strain CSF55) TaxID=988480 RepID=A0A4P9YJX6_ROZAC|nr:ARM repeat-containing protein [Rozella allomycis CSF55]
MFAEDNSGGMAMVRDIDGEIYAYDFREVAPEAAFKDMFKNDPSGLSVAVPGELKERFALLGLEWNQLITPSIELAHDIMNEPTLREVFAPNGVLLELGDTMYRKNYADTLEAISENGPAIFYSGKVGQSVVDFVQERGGVLTMEDLKKYKSIQREVVNGTFKGSQIYSIGAPGSGNLIITLLNILEGYGDEEPEPAVYVQRIVESLKFVYGIRSTLGDPMFNKTIYDFVKQSVNKTFADSMRKRIHDDETFDPEYYSSAKIEGIDDHGTTHISIIDKDGISFSLTSTVKPLKRPQSSMAPIIIEREGQPWIVTGGSGGSYIISAVIQKCCKWNRFFIYRSNTGSRNIDIRKAAFKNKALSKDEIRRRRDEQTVEIRKNKREESLNKRRNLVEQSEPAQTVESEKLSRLERLPHLISSMISEDLQVRFDAVREVRRLLSNEHNPPIDVVIQGGAVPICVEFIKPNREIVEKIQLEAAWVLTNIASGTSAQTAIVMQHGAVPQFLNMLNSSNSELQEQAIWALGNIAGDCASARDHVLECGILEILIPIVNFVIENPQNYKISFLRNSVWALSNLCRGKSPSPPWSKIALIIPTLSRLINYPDDEVVGDACWAFSYLTDGANTKIQQVIDAGVVPRLVQLLNNGFSTITPALRALGNIAVLDAGFLQYAGNLLFSHRDNTVKETCWAISNITAGTEPQVQAVINANLIPPLISILQNASDKVKKEACWAICNATSYKLERPDQIRSRDSRIIQTCLDALERILEVGETLKDQSPGLINPYALNVEEAGGMETICDLQSHNLDDIYHRSKRIIDKFFGAEDEEIDMGENFIGYEQNDMTVPQGEGIKKTSISLKESWNNIFKKTKKVKVEEITTPKENTYSPKGVVPFYRRVPGTMFVVDEFKRTLPDCTAHFLTCPGAAMIIFELKDGSKYLHTGDCRLIPEITNSLKYNYLFKTVFLDTTYCDPNYSFPDQKVIIKETSNAIKEYTSGKKVLVVVGTYKIGKERIAIALNTRIYIPPTKRKVYNLLQFPELNELTTDDPLSASVHVYSMMNLTIPVPYSEHSSCEELKNFVQSIKCNRFIPTVSGRRGFSAVSAILNSWKK